jgi:hypothetical protein
MHSFPDIEARLVKLKVEIDAANAKTSTKKVNQELLRNVH